VSDEELVLLAAKIAHLVEGIETLHAELHQWSCCI
jgi:hypothetical protein